MGTKLQGFACIAFGIADFFLGGFWIILGVFMILVGLALILKKEQKPESKSKKRIKGGKK